MTSYFTESAKNFQLKMASLCDSRFSDCSESSFKEAVAYALERLGTPGFDLKEEQKLAIRAVYERKDVFVWLPTGFGKSVCFQTLPFLFDYKLGMVGTLRKSVVLVIVPLVALMIDQVQALRCEEVGVDAIIISSGGRGAKVPQDLLATEASLSTASLVFCSPEALAQDKWKDILEKPGFSERVQAIAVDEAHCVSKWYVVPCVALAS